MTPQEKAEELVGKMFHRDHYTPEDSMAMLYPHAKQCALIAVDEIINTLKTMHKYMVFPKQVIYWQEVKTEIEKL